MEAGIALLESDGKEVDVVLLNLDQPDSRARRGSPAAQALLEISAAQNFCSASDSLRQ